MNTDTSSNYVVNTEKLGRRKAKSDKSIGMCLSCGHKITLCGRPFSAEITCRKCHVINVFKESQQPIEMRDLDGNVLTASQAVELS